jgi:hypothetical protein
MPTRCHVAVVLAFSSRSSSTAAVQTLNKLSAIQCNKAACRICHACQLGKHARLPFASSVSSTLEPFERPARASSCDAQACPAVCQGHPLHRASHRRRQHHQLDSLL